MVPSPPGAMTLTASATPRLACVRDSAPASLVKKFGIHDGSIAPLSWLLASLMTAFCAHALIDRAGAWFGGDPDLHADAYVTHAHVAIVPIFLLTSMLLTGMLLSIAARAVARRERKSDGVEALAQELRRIRPAPAMGLVASGGLTILHTLEFRRSGEYLSRESDPMPCGGEHVLHRFGQLRERGLADDVGHRAARRNAAVLPALR